MKRGNDLTINLKTAKAVLSENFIRGLNWRIEAESVHHRT
jgi:hypothetical protein